MNTNETNNGLNSSNKQVIYQVGLIHRYIEFPNHFQTNNISLLSDISVESRQNSISVDNNTQLLNNINQSISNCITDLDKDLDKSNTYPKLVDIYKEKKDLDCDGNDSSYKAPLIFKRKKTFIERLFCC